METCSFQVTSLAACPPDVISECKLLTVPSSQFLYSESVTEHQYSIVVLARLSGLLVGLCLAQVYPTQQTAQIYSIFVLPGYRKQGIGFRLMSTLQNHLIDDCHIDALGLEYDKKLEDSVSLEKILHRCGWPTPYFYLLRCFINPQTFNPSWLYSPIKLPKGAELFFWSSLKESEKNYIKTAREQMWHRSYLSPFHQQDLVDDRFSLGLRYQKAIVGWCITHLLEPNLICYRSLYTEPSFQCLGTGIYLLKESILLLKQSLITQALFEVKVREIDPSWAQFIKKRLLPSAFKVERKNWAMFHFPRSTNPKA